jgi:hypothetical protein
MRILVGLVLALVLLYFWLLGHWFARVVMFLALAALFGLLGALFRSRRAARAQSRVDRHSIWVPGMLWF